MSRPLRPKSNSPKPGTRVLEEALVQLASILLRLGIDSPRSERLLRQAFVKAASLTAGNKSRRTTQSQIASLAGISRLEVRRLMRLQAQPQQPKTSRLSRIDRVMAGWMTDVDFANSKGSPKPLDFDGANSSFEKLVRKYGRDVTKRTLMRELVSRKLATEKNGLLHLNSSAVNISTSATPSSALADLKFLNSSLSGFDFTLGRRGYVVRKISLAAPDRKSLLRVQRETLKRADVMLAALRVFEFPKGQSQLRLRSPRRRVIVTTSVTTECGDEEHA
ncbi:MAG TPA: DUF6502 family protein [Steroidobacteraceae bacterium]|nr:DUF6502 family protein [Steroidobacteraceae bacterium]